MYVRVRTYTGSIVSAGRHVHKVPLGKVPCVRTLCMYLWYIHTGHIRTCTRIRTYVRSCVCTYVYVHTHRGRYACTCTYVHTYMYTYACLRMLLLGPARQAAASCQQEPLRPFGRGARARALDAASYQQHRQHRVCLCVRVFLSDQSSVQSTRAYVCLGIHTCTCVHTHSARYLRYLVPVCMCLCLRIVSAGRQISRIIAPNHQPKLCFS